VSITVQWAEAERYKSNRYAGKLAGSAMLRQSVQNLNHGGEETTYQVDE